MVHHPSPETTTAAAGAPARGTKLQKRVLAGGAIGQFVEFYDFSLYALSAVTLAALFFPEGDDWFSLLAVFATFGVAFFVRPLGGLFFGALGDRIGRKPVLFITLVAIGGATTVIGLLPTYAQIGALAPILLVFCRLVQGFSAGGESVGAPAFVMEHAPLDRRGLWLNITISATVLPSVVASALILGLSTWMPADAFASWGWRIPFLLALPLSLVGLWIRSRTEESELFKQVLRKQEQAEFSPVAEAFRENRGRMLQTTLICGLTALGFYFLSGYFVTSLQTTGGFDRGQSLGITAIVMSVAAVIMPLTGALGDRIGRKPMMITGAALYVLLAVPSFGLATNASLWVTLLGLLIYIVPLAIYGGGAVSFFVEAFNTKTRFTSAAISYNVGYALFGGTAPFIGTWLVGITGNVVAPGIYLAVYAGIVLLVLLFTGVPETHPLKQRQAAAPVPATAAPSDAKVAR